jgi:LmbE family N-acetylglucosaminyl deacetylase
MHQIRDAIRQIDPEIVISHGTDGEYGHPAHQLLHRAVFDAIQKSSSSPLFYTFAANDPSVEDRLLNVSDPAHLILDVRPWLDAKEAAALCHETQSALFKRRTEAETVREVLRTVESFHRHFPPVADGTPMDSFAQLLRTAGAWSPQE